MIFYYAILEMLTINVDSVNVTCTTASFTTANANNDAVHNAHRNGWL